MILHEQCQYLTQNKLVMKGCMWFFSALNLPSTLHFEPQGRLNISNWRIGAPGAILHFAFEKHIKGQEFMN